MKTGVYYLESTNVSGIDVNKENLQLLKELQEKTGIDLPLVRIEEAGDCDLLLVFVAGGGTEGRFLEVLDRLPRPVFLLTVGKNNSLAASMEILSYLQQEGIEGEIIHGSFDYIARRIQNLHKVFTAGEKLHHFRIGRVGVPSDWLISSLVDAEKSKQLNGIEIVDVDMREFFEEIAKKQFEPNRYTQMIMDKPFDEDEKLLSLYIYGALKRICERYSLQGVTVRCFDLLEPVKSTGCSALAILNAEGIYAACEGDVPALISMAVLGELTGEPVFMANPSRIDTDNNEMVFAHCTLPLNMPEDIQLMTHYESDLGVAFRGRIAEGDITVFKCSGLMDRYFISRARLLENLSEANLCRTQIRIKLEESVDYFLRNSIGNHHLIVKGDHADILDEFFRWF
ncbi:MAG: hypothetical protein II126_03550 [Erysipelotrichaceae bacterium]|nr:hypothetical protein [Erysipelotrichaceae bacterium]